MWCKYLCLHSRAFSIILYDVWHLWLFCVLFISSSSLLLLILFCLLHRQFLLWTQKEHVVLPVRFLSPVCSKHSAVFFRWTEYTSVFTDRYSNSFLFHSYSVWMMQLSTTEPKWREKRKVVFPQLNWDVDGCYGRQNILGPNVHSADSLALLWDVYNFILFSCQLRDVSVFFFF